MKDTLKRALLPICAALLLSVLAPCPTGAALSALTALAQDAPASTGAASPRAPATLDLTDATVITLLDNSASVKGAGAAAKGGIVTITAAGLYVISGTLEEGRVIVDAPGEDVTPALSDARIACSYGSPLYIYKAKTATVHLMAGTANALTDGNSYTFADEYSSAEDEEPNACLYSKADLVIEGAGRLDVTACHNNGITGKDTLQIYDCYLAVTAVNHGVSGKDSVAIDSAALAVYCGGDAIRSTNAQDTALGWVRVSNSTLELTAGEDGIQAETALTMEEGHYAITSGGSSAQPASSLSAKGLKAGTSLTLTGGDYTMDCSDDAIHANGDVNISGGTYALSIGDDAFHADEALAISGGNISVLTSYEGLESTTVAVSGGTIAIVSSDDGVNAAGGTDGSGLGGMGPGNSFGGANSASRIDISGGGIPGRSGERRRL